jgi:DinB family protein
VQAQLETIVADFASAQRRLDELGARLSDKEWAATLDPTRWSAVQCIQHLNLTSRAFLPIIREALEKCTALNGRPPGRYRHDFAGWILWRGSGPVRGFGRIRTTPPFIPLGVLSAVEVLSEFARLQRDQIKCVRDGDGLPLDRVKVTSPFFSRLSYSAYSALALLPRHQHRHIQQAEAAAKTARG